jgi:hypothetical protein
MTGATDGTLVQTLGGDSEAEPVTAEPAFRKRARQRLLVTGVTGSTRVSQPVTPEVSAAQMAW